MRRRIFISRYYGKDIRAINSLPLILLVLIVVAAVGLGILIIWYNSVNDPQSIKAIWVMEQFMSPNQVHSIIAAPKDPDVQAGGKISENFIVKAIDEDENVLPGVSITIEGCGAFGSAVTREDGCAYWGDWWGGQYDAGDLKVVLAPGQQYGSIFIKATKEGWGSKNIELPVVRGDIGSPDPYDGVLYASPQ